MSSLEMQPNNNSVVGRKMSFWDKIIFALTPAAAVWLLNNRDYLSQLCTDAKLQNCWGVNCKQFGNLFGRRSVAQKKVKFVHLTDADFDQQ